MKFLRNILIILLTFSLTSCSTITEKIDIAGMIDSTENWLFGNEEELSNNKPESTKEQEVQGDVAEAEEVFPNIEEIPEERPEFEEIDRSFFEDDEEEIKKVIDQKEDQLEVVEVTENNQVTSIEINNIKAVMNIRQNVRLRIVRLLMNSDPPVKETAPLITENILDKEATKVAIIQFPNNSIIPDEDASNVIDEIVKTYASKKIKLVGHASKLGSTNDAGKRKNMEISIARAVTIKNMLINKGFSSDLIYTFGKGDIEPLKKETEKYGEAVNRRVEVFFISE